MRWLWALMAGGWLAAAEPPAAPVGWQWGEFRNAQGARLRYGHATPAGATAHVAVFGGYTEFAEKYFEVLREWHAAGYGVWFMDWRGQGGSDRYHRERERAILVNLDDDARDVHDFLRRHLSGARVCVAGHSLGAHILVRYLHRYPGEAACAVLSSPTLALAKIPWMPPWLIQARVGWGMGTGQAREWATGEHEWRDGPQRAAVEATLSSDPRRRLVQRQWFRARPDWRLGGLTYQWLDTFLRSSAEVLTPPYLSAIRTPVLMGTAADDVLASVEAQRWAARHLRDVTQMEFAPALHELFMEAERVREPWMRAIEAFLARQLRR